MGLSTSWPTSTFGSVPAANLRLAGSPIKCLLISSPSVGLVLRRPPPQPLAAQRKIHVMAPFLFEGKFHACMHVVADVDACSQ